MYKSKCVKSGIFIKYKINKQTATFEHNPDVLLKNTLAHFITLTHIIINVTSEHNHIRHSNIQHTHNVLGPKTHTAIFKF